jgi:hypothetical protein
MSKEGFDELVLKARLRREVKTNLVVSVKKFVKHAPKDILFPVWLFRCVFKISLHFVPVVGPLILIVLDGPAHAKKMHGRYFELKGYDSKEVSNYV